MKIFIIIILILYFVWCRLEKYNKVDYGNKHINRLMGLNQLVSRKYHRLGDYWLDLPEGTGAIIAANHTSGMDPAILTAAAKRPVRFLATEYYYNMPLAHSVCKAAGCIPVYKSKDNSKSLAKAVEALKKGEIIGIFPFGGIHSPFKPEPRLRSGVAVLSKLANVPIIPVYIGGMNKFSFNRVFTSMFFKRSNINVTQYKEITYAKSTNPEKAVKSEQAEQINQILDQLYPLLSNHVNIDKLILDTNKELEKENI